MLKINDTPLLTACFLHVCNIVRLKVADDLLVYVHIFIKKIDDIECILVKLSNGKSKHFQALDKLIK